MVVTYIFCAKRFAADCLGDSLLGLGDEVMLLRYRVMSFLYLSCMPMLVASTFKESPFSASVVLENELHNRIVIVINVLSKPLAELLF